MSNSVGDVLKSKQKPPTAGITTGRNKLLKITTGTSNKYDNDYLYEQLGDLVNHEFKPWYIKAFYKLGRRKVLKLASQARADGDSGGARLFSYLLKRELKNTLGGAS